MSEPSKDKVIEQIKSLLDEFNEYSADGLDVMASGCIDQIDELLQDLR